MFSNPEFTRYGQVYKIIRLLACTKKCLIGDLEHGGLVLGGVTGLCSSEGPAALESTEAYNPYTDKPPKIVTLRNAIMSCFWGVLAGGLLSASVIHVRPLETKVRVN